MKKYDTIISKGDFIDLYYKVRQRGIGQISQLFHLSEYSRTASKWNNANSSSDFWIIPEVRKRWNEKCTGNPDLEYEDYLVSKYLSGSEELKMLSIGCGAGAREIKFAKYPCFKKILGIDIASRLIAEANDTARSMHHDNLSYSVCNFYQHCFENESFDLILFNSSLHHFKNINQLIPDKILPLLKKNGLLVIFEYTGPNRLHWTTHQLEVANHLLKELPEAYKLRYNSKSVKKRIYRPGLLRMMMVDPSEACDSESIIPVINKYFNTVEEKSIGWNLTQLLLKDIAHNFLNNNEETKMLLDHIFTLEDEFIASSGKSDAVFGIYRRK
jgi:ubiquinone/menaquinone biosynthesis C-methylase UbiE